MQAGCTVHNHGALLHCLGQVLLRHGRMCLGCLKRIHRVVTSLYKRTSHKRSIDIPCHILRQPYLVQIKSAVRYHNTTPYGVHHSSEHFSLECTILGRLAERPFEQPFNGLLLELTILGLVQPNKLLPFIIKHSTRLVLVLLRQALCSTQVITGVDKLCIQIVAVCYHSEPTVTCYRPELRGQHRYPLQHELCGMYTDAPHTFNGYIALQGSIFLRLGCSLELC